MKRLLSVFCLSLTLCSSCSTKSQLTTTNSYEIFGYYATPQQFLILENDSTFEFGKRGGVILNIASGTYKTDGIKLILSVNKTHSLYPELDSKDEQGYIDYEHNIIYAFGRRLKKK